MFCIACIVFSPIHIPLLNAIPCLFRLYKAAMESPLNKSDVTDAYHKYTVVVIKVIENKCMYMYCKCKAKDKNFK